MRDGNLNAMQNQYGNWLERAKELSEKGELEITEAIYEELDDIAAKNGFEEIIKDDLIIFYKDDQDKFIFAWHNDHNREFSIDETGFDSYLDLNTLHDLFYQKLISKEAYRTVFREMIEISAIPEKLKGATEKYLNNPEKITKEEYQNIYHNLYRKDPKKLRSLANKYFQKAELAKFFRNIDLTGGE
jgi:hypothetical protein